MYREFPKQEQRPSSVDTRMASAEFYTMLGFPFWLYCFLKVLLHVAGV